MLKSHKHIHEQLSKLSGLKHSIDGVDREGFPEDFKNIVFYKNSSSNGDKVKVIFMDYIIKPFEGFDFHEKWNNNVPPPSKEMYGEIVEEREKMYKFRLHPSTSSTIWEGWCPKKSCIVRELS